MAKLYKATLLHDSYGGAKHRPGQPPQGRELERHVFLKKGTVIEDEEAWLLVRMGHADGDPECLAKAIEGGQYRHMHLPPTTKDAIAEARERFLNQAVGRLTGNPRLDAPDPNSKEESLADAARS